MIYDAQTKQPVESPDLEKGYLVEGSIVTGTALEVMAGTVTDDRPQGLRRRVPVREACQWYCLNPEPSEPEKTMDEKISDAVTAAVALAQGGMA